MVIGREAELITLKEYLNAPRAGILVVYGRRRVGKTTLIEYAFKKERLLKIEGIEKQGKSTQIRRALEQLQTYFPDELVATSNIKSWSKFFKLLANLVKAGRWVIFLEEFQWLSNYSQEMTAELKYAFDNYFQKNPKLKIIICGSAPSFIVKNVLHSKALHNRALDQLHLKPLSLKETRELLGPGVSLQEAMDGLLTVGGIPEYLIYLKKRSSVLLSLAQESFKPDGFFVDELARVAVSSLAENQIFFNIIEILAKKKFSTRNELLKQLKEKSGSNMTRFFDDLELCGFIEKYHPFNFGDNSKVQRYRIADPYLGFYYKFIKPCLSEIRRGSYSKTPLRALDQEALTKWRGFAFERYCLNHSAMLAEILGFSAVRYQAGTYFERNSTAQIDLIFERADRVLTVCEVKYTTQPTSKKVIPEFEKKLEMLRSKFKCSIQKVLITAAGADKSLTNTGYFDRIVSLKDFY